MDAFPFPMLWATKNNLLALKMIRGERSVMVGSEASGGQGWGGEGGGPVYKIEGENGALSSMKLQHSSSFRHWLRVKLVIQVRQSRPMEILVITNVEVLHGNLEWGRW